MLRKLIVGIAAFLIVTTGLVLNSPKEVAQSQTSQLSIPSRPNITDPIPGHLPYTSVVAKIKEWSAKAPQLTDIGIYGKSSRNQDLYYIKVTNKLDKNVKKKVLITACIHGNEPLASSTVMGYIGTILATYGQDKEVTELLNSREIWFVPVFSPDSFPNSRIVDGVDPNRDFPGPSNPGHVSVPPVKAIQALFKQERFNAVISGHTFGRVLLTPYGDRNEVCPNEADYGRIIGQMASMCQYGKKRACQVYGRPISGSEVDWYYREGSFSIVMEFGTHQVIPSMNDVKFEFERTYRGFLYFCKESPLVKINKVEFNI